ncbi:MAG: DHH family phosphoesterase [Clostridiales bacterium]|nr:DHH family phosphoesterase [Clostridiales bacterium]
MDNQYIRTLPIPACSVDPDGKVSGANPLMKNVFVYEDIIGYSFFTLTGFKREQLMNANTEEIILERNDKTFKLWINEEAKDDEDIVVFFDEATVRESFRSRLERDRAAIAYINIDNYDELIASAPEDYRRVIPAQIDLLVRKWGDSFESPVISTGDDRYVMYTNQGKLEGMIESNFSVLDEVRKIESQIDFPASISIGAGLSNKSLLESTELAEAALELALGRGGDQAVVKTDDGTRYYGGTMQSFEKNNRSKPRVIAHAIKALVDDADKVFIMGHRWPDMDAFGAAIGASAICHFLGKDSYIVIDKHNEALDAVYDHAADTEDYNIIKPERALRMVTDRSLLIIVDTNRPVLVECPELEEACKTRVIIDHHRLTADSYQNSAVAYIETYASSASELMAELMQHFSQKRFINKLEAEVMLAGIMVDSNHFSVRTGVRTFDAASWLKRGGADTTEVKRFFQVKQEDFTAKAEAIAGAEFSDDGVAYATSDVATSNTQIINAQVSDELMTVKGTKAAFALGRNERGQTVVSARSLGELNVQMIMEKLGGGGHFTAAAVQTDEPLAEVLAKIKKLVKEYFEREEEERRSRMSRTQEIELIR